MPEDAEVDLDTLHERIHEELEHEGGRLLKFVALTTACLAALAAVASLQAGATVNEALAMKTEAAVLQAQASDQWAYYQAKGIKGVIAQTASNVWQAAGKPVPAKLDSTVQHYAQDQKEITTKARELEQERDQKSVEAEHLMHRHHGFANAVALFQIAIALGAITALTRSKPMYVGSLALGAVGLVFFVLQYV
ncbi:MAG TPA: DUF4337 domain-containing protein [Gemmatimonadaceae bacterium]|jgi:hypothetical protein|nr:DUF4337 domain-containing protein [Gemmatimonadaceae bacterium]